MMSLHVGSTVLLSGDTTTLNWISVRSASRTEDALGFERGRLAAGYWLGVLRTRPQARDFEFAGTTLRSGGRLGLPAETFEQDSLRPHVSDEMRRRYGDAQHEEMKRRSSASSAIHGERRLVKIVPASRHDPRVTPAIQYPAGGGGLQWTIRTPHPFFIALQVGADGKAKFLRQEIDLPRAGYDEVAEIARYLRTC